MECWNVLMHACYGLEHVWCCGMIMHGSVVVHLTIFVYFMVFQWLSDTQHAYIRHTMPTYETMHAYVTSREKATCLTHY